MSGPAGWGWPRVEPAGDRLVVTGSTGARSVAVAELAQDQSAFAVPIDSRTEILAPGLHLAGRTVDLPGGGFSNVYDLVAERSATRVAPHSSGRDFVLGDLCETGLAAVGGSFSFISDDPAYQPAELCLDFCAREGRVVSLPTATRPAVLDGPDGPSVLRLPAGGRLEIAGREHRWVGAKESADPADPEALRVFGAAHCRIAYAADPRTGFRRHVLRSNNKTPAEPDVVDLLVVDSGAGLRVRAVLPGGGTDLFAGSFVLRGPARRFTGVAVGDRVRITEVGGRPSAESAPDGFSLGPTLADAARGELHGFDACLGVSPFADQVRYARTIVWMCADRVWFRIFDGAPLAPGFTGVSAAEARDLCAADGMDPDQACHLDGGQSSRIAFRTGHGLAVVGSLHYLRWPRTPDEPFAWRGRTGRALRSAFRVDPR